MKSVLSLPVLRAFKRSSLLRTRELESLGLWRAQLGPLVQRGILARAGRGLYPLPTAEVTEHHDLANAAKRVPHGVVCLLSALQFHRLTTQIPHHIWLALDGKARRPIADTLPLRVVRSSGEALYAGQEQHEVEGVAVKVYCPAKTVADCFKFRNKIGLDVAPGSPAGNLARKGRHDRRDDALRTDLSRRERHAALPGEHRISTSMRSTISRSLVARKARPCSVNNWSHAAPPMRTKLPPKSRKRS